MKNAIKLLTKSHLKTLRSLTQFERCWSVIDSHLALYDEVEKLREQSKVRDIIEGGKEAKKEVKRFADSVNRRASCRNCGGGNLTVDCDDADWFFER